MFKLMAPVKNRRDFLIIFPAVPPPSAAFPQSLLPLMPNALPFPKTPKTVFRVFSLPSFFPAARQVLSFFG